MKAWLIGLVIGLCIGGAVSGLAQSNTLGPYRGSGYPLLANVQGILMTAKKPDGTPSVISVDNDGRVYCAQPTQAASLFVKGLIRCGQDAHPVEYEITAGGGVSASFPCGSLTLSNGR